jgi:hypothetical protein
MEERRSAHRVLVGKTEGKKLLGGPRQRWEDNTKMDLMELGWKGLDWIGLAQDIDRWWAVMNKINNPHVP